MLSKLYGWLLLAGFILFVPQRMLAQAIKGDVLEDSIFLGGVPKGELLDISDDGNRLIYLKEEGPFRISLLTKNWDGARWLATTQPILVDSVFLNASLSFSLEISGDGQCMAIGQPEFNSSFQKAGKVLLYHWSESNWIYDKTLEGNLENGLFGSSIKFSNDGKTLAVGAPGSRELIDSGKVYIFKKTNDIWNLQTSISSTQESMNFNFGDHIYISGEGNKIAVGIPEALNSKGVVQLYRQSGLKWDPIDVLEGTYDGQRFGSDLSPSRSLDSILIVSQPYQTPFFTTDSAISFAELWVKEAAPEYQMKKRFNGKVLASLNQYHDGVLQMLKLDMKPHLSNDGKEIVLFESCSYFITFNGTVIPGLFQYSDLNYHKSAEGDWQNQNLYWPGLSPNRKIFSHIDFSRDEQNLAAIIYSQNLPLGGQNPSIDRILSIFQHKLEYVPTFYINDQKDTIVFEGNKSLVINDSNGQFSQRIELTAGKTLLLDIEEGYTITPLLPESWEAYPPFSVIDSLVLNAPNRDYQINDSFFLVPPADEYGLEIDHLINSPIAEGTEVFHKIKYRNRGGKAQDGIIEFYYNPEVEELVTATPKPLENINGRIIWDYEDLKGLQEQEIQFSLLVADKIDSSFLDDNYRLCYEALILPISGDREPSNNEETAKCANIGLFIEANDKLCLNGNEIAAEEVGKEVQYLIRFEYEGEGTAVNVEVVDPIDPAVFNIETFRMIETSDPVRARIVGDSIIFQFDGIYLEQNTSKPAGYLVFGIETWDDLTHEDTLINRALISYDQKAKVVTKDEVTMIRQTVETVHERDTRQALLYPNPTYGSIQIESDEKIKDIKIYSPGGVLVRDFGHGVIWGNRNQLNLEHLTPGTYFVQIIYQNKTDFIPIVVH
jgi:hypothetical protein